MLNVPEMRRIAESIGYNRDDVLALIALAEQLKAALETVEMAGANSAETWEEFHRRLVNAALPALVAAREAGL